MSERSYGRRRAALRTARTPVPKKPNVLVRLLFAAVVLVLLLSGGAAAAAYATITSLYRNLPTLKGVGHNIRFENTQFMTKAKQVLYDMPDLNIGNRIVKPLELNSKNPHQCPDGRHTKHLKFYYTCTGAGIPLAVRDATIATEDPTFYSNPGFDPTAILHAAYEDVTSGGIVRGGSTITQQFVKQYILKNDSPTLIRKAREVLLAWRLTQKYPKDFILYYYLNSVYYGHLAYGVEAAAQTYFHVNVPQLKLWQSAMIAGMPQSPNALDPFNDPSSSGLWYSRMVQVLNYMQERGYISNAQVQQAQTEAKLYTFRVHSNRVRQPKFVKYAIDQFQAMTDPERPCSSSRGTNWPCYDHYLVSKLNGRNIFDGLRFITTINPQLQMAAEQTVHNQVESLVGYNVTDGALVSVDTRPGCDGCLLAMVGTADVDKKTTLVNMADSPRQPGSSFKVFNYLSAFEKGIYPGTIVDDLPLNIPDDSEPTGYYSPTNYDLSYHGAVSIRTALANSLNVPAVKVELWNGVGTVAATAHRLGISDIWKDNPNCCQYALTLGGMDRGVTLAQETEAYGAFATGGYRVPILAFTRIVNRSNGHVLWKANKDPLIRRLRRTRVAPASSVFMTNSILSDDNARVMEFGPDSALQLDRTAAAKTGTTNAFTDNWTVGYTPNQIVTGVWVGNADNGPMATGVNGVTGAAPIWHTFMEDAFSILNLPVTDFYTQCTTACQPPDIITGSQCIDASTQTLTYSPYSDFQVGNKTPYCSVPTVPGLDDQPSTNYVQPTPTPTSPYVAPIPTATTAPPVVIEPGNTNQSNGGQPVILPVR